LALGVRIECAQQGTHVLFDVALPHLLCV
jgi:hypothetical protein